MSPLAWTMVAAVLCLVPAGLAAAAVLWLWPRWVGQNFLCNPPRWRRQRMPCAAYALAALTGTMTWTACLFASAWALGWFAWR